MEIKWQPDNPGQWMSPKQWKRAGLYWMLLGIIIVCAGAYFGYDTASFLKTSKRAPGVILSLTERLQEGSDNQKTTVYYPVFSFVDQSGGNRMVESKSGSNPPSHKVGARVTVLYDPENPSHAEIDSFNSVWLAPVGMVLMGLVFCGMGFLLNRFPPGRPTINSPL